MMPNIVLLNDGSGSFERSYVSGSLTADSERNWEVHVVDLVRHVTQKGLFDARPLKALCRGESHSFLSS